MDRLEVEDKLSVLLESYDLEEVFDMFNLDPMEIIMILWDRGMIDEESL